MKYLKITKTGNTLSAKELKGGEFFVNKNGSLYHIVGKTVTTLRKGEWAALQAPVKAKKPANYSFYKPYKLSEELQAITKSDRLVRTEVIKRLWKFIKDNGLQNEQNKRMIDVSKNPLTKALFQKSQVNMFEMTKLLMKHMKEVR